MIEEQVQFWMIKNSSEKQFARRGQKLPIITVSREFGAKGAALASELGEKLGFKVWDKDLLQIISEKLGSNKEFIQSLDENRRSLVEDTIFGFLNQRGTNLNYLIYLVRTVRAIERYGNSIIVGRGANYICQKPNSFHVRVVCPLKKRIADYAQKENISKDEAYVIIEQKDTERESFTKYNFNRDVSTPSDYDLVINSASFSLDEMVELAIDAYQRKIGYQIRILDYH